MRIIVDYKDSDAKISQLKIDSAKYMSDYVIQIIFNDGIVKLIDFKPFLSKSLHPSINKYLDKNMFSNFSLTDLYNGRIGA